MAYLKLIWDTPNSENRTYSRSILITVYNSLCFGCVKEMSQGDVSLMYPKHMFDRGKIYNNQFWGLYIFMSTSL